jgi:hypothetical protein
VAGVLCCIVDLDCVDLAYLMQALEVVTMPLIHDATRLSVDEAVDISGTFLSLY